MPANTESKIANYDSALTRCLVEGDPAAVSSERRSRHKALGMSFAIEAALLGSLIVAPLLTSVAQPQLRHTFLPPVILGIWNSHTTERPRSLKQTHAPVILMGGNFGLRLRSPVAGPRRTEEPDNSSISEPFGQYIIGAIPITDLGEGTAEPPPPAIEKNKPDEKRTVKRSEGVQLAQLISRVELRYPIIAIQTRTEGTVRLRAIIRRDGGIAALEAVSGPPLLVQAALDAVRQWRYRPTYLNGEAVEVDTFITVIFRLHQ